VRQRFAQRGLGARESFAGADVILQLQDEFSPDFAGEFIRLLRDHLAAPQAHGQIGGKGEKEKEQAQAKDQAK